MKNYVLKTKFLVFPAIVFLGLFFCFGVKAAILGETRNFYLDPSYDLKGRSETSAVLVLETNKLYFYIDNSLWQSFPGNEKSEIISNLFGLSSEFENRIYPILTSNFGFEWTPGIDNDSKITILFHPLKKKAGGYFNNGNEYSRFEAPTSNEREMVYINSDYLASPLLKQLLAHEFVHLIAFNQKERIQKTEENIWLNEARAEYAPTLLGYDENYQGSNLQKRVIEFLKNPSNSITEWEGSSSDYSVLNLFIQYLVDHYGVKILNDSLRSYKIGIESINAALVQNGYKEDFSQIFTDWTIAVLVNDCSLGEKYCYKNKNLKNIRILPINDLTLANPPSDLFINYSVKVWTGNWQRIWGREGTLTFEFNGPPGKNFKVPYVTCDLSDVCSVEFLNLDENQRGKIVINNFKKYASLVIIPSFQNNSSISESTNFSLRIKIGNQNQEEELINQLLARIDSLKAEVARLQAQIAVLSGQNTDFCKVIVNNLYFGIENNSEVRCLQEFLKQQGPEIYPERLITGNFLELTKNAVIKFQEKYADEILKPIGLENGTGYVGVRTKLKINGLLAK